MQLHKIKKSSETKARLGFPRVLFDAENEPEVRFYRIPLKFSTKFPISYNNVRKNFATWVFYSIFSVLQNFT